MNTSAKILAAMVAGIAAGAVIGVLFAPDKGSETRKKISNEGKKLAKGFTDKIDKGKATLNELKNDIKQTVKEKVEEFV